MSAEILTPREAAELLGYSTVQCIHLLVKEEMLVPVYTPLSKRPRYRREDVLGLVSTTAPEVPLFEKPRESCGKNKEGA